MVAALDRVALGAPGLGDHARDVLDGGGVLAIPTESSYGLAVDPRSGRGVDAIYQLKARERGKPLPVVLAEPEQAGILGVDLTTPLFLWAKEQWPAALSVVLPLACDAPAVPAAAGTGSLALRVPDHSGLCRLISGIDCPLTATSANPAGQPAMLEPQQLLDWFRGIENRPRILVVDGGVLAGGLPSTVVVSRAGRPVVLRRGRVELAAVNRPSEPEC